MPACANPECPKDGFVPVRAGQKYCCDECRYAAHNHEKSSRVAMSENVPGSDDNPGEAIPGHPEGSTHSTDAPATDSGLEMPSWLERSTAFATVRGEKLKLDFVAPAGDPFGKCRTLKALALSGRIGFRASNGMIGIVVTIDAGAALAVRETQGQSARIGKYRPFVAWDDHDDHDDDDG